MSKWKQR